MAKRDLKEQNKDLEIHVVDLINKFDPSNTGKYTRFLIKMLKDRIEESKKQRHDRLIVSDGENGFVRPQSENELEDVILQYLRDVYGYDNMDTLISFHKHTQENRITGKDINDYSNWDEIRRDVSLATFKQTQRLLEKEVQKVFETDNWVVVKPLTFEASTTYGAGTKWCTASRNNPEYFYRYSRNGVLYYAINKMDADKFGIFYDIHSREFSIWDAPDRRIDSIESTIPNDLMFKIHKLIKTEKHNYHYFSDSEKSKCELEFKKYEQERPVPETVEVAPPIGILTNEADIYAGERDGNGYYVTPRLEEEAQLTPRDYIEAH